ncbi:MAG: class I SAM-dependent methyltransferase [Deltaproteobacteria bacterium]|nr:class I SAM-dependent methyltransferase [Deltaproteobacteria bacterium]
MRKDTALALRAINAEFYGGRGQGGSSADAFAESRTRPWPGFLRALDAARRADAAKPLRILDVGCGPGRLPTFALSRGPVDYLGIDASPELIAIARERLGTSANLDLRVVDVLDEALPRGPFDMVAAFAVLHHVPARSTRLELVARLAQQVGDAGTLALSAWRVDEPRFRRKQLEWARRPEIDPDDLEAGDRLLSFRGAMRYVHAVDDDELAAWAEASGLHLVERFWSDGPGGTSNSYLVLRRGGSFAAK